MRARVRVRVASDPVDGGVALYLKGAAAGLEVSVHGVDRSCGYAVVVGPRVVALVEGVEVDVERDEVECCGSSACEASEAGSCPGCDCGGVEGDGKALGEEGGRVVVGAVERPACDAWVAWP